MVPTEIKYFQHGPRSEFRNLAGLIPQLGSWAGFLENFLDSSSQQQFQVKSSRNARELKWLSLCQATTEYFGKQRLLRSFIERFQK